MVPPMKLAAGKQFLSLRGRFRVRHILITLLIGGVVGQLFVLALFWPPIWDWPIHELLSGYVEMGGYVVSAFAVCAGMGASCISLEFLGPRFVRRDKPSTDAEISGDDSQFWSTVRERIE